MFLNSLCHFPKRLTLLGIVTCANDPLRSVFYYFCSDCELVRNQRVKVLLAEGIFFSIAVLQSHVGEKLHLPQW